jgi:hypothetical protein
MITNDTIIQSIVIAYFVGLFISILAAMMYYSNYLSAINDNEYNFFGSWFGSGYRLKSDFTFFIDDNVEDEFTKKIIKQHRKAVIFLWSWILMLVPVIIICNLLD